MTPTPSPNLQAAWHAALAFANDSPPGRVESIKEQYLERRYAMDTMNIALPPTMKDFVQVQVEGSGYSSVSEYVRRLIRADQERQARQETDRKLLEALDGGPATP